MELGTDYADWRRDYVNWKSARVYLWCSLDIICKYEYYSDLPNVEKHQVPLNSTVVVEIKPSTTMMEEEVKYTIVIV